MREIRITINDAANGYIVRFGGPTSADPTSRTKTMVAMNGDDVMGLIDDEFKAKVTEQDPH
jgi:hypothetical protein